MRADRFGPIFDPTRSVVLLASAGTGKTWRLVRRYLRIISARPESGESGGHEAPGRGIWARPEEVVAVTFTRAAAAQMRARVFAALTGSGEGLDPADDPVLAELHAERSLDERLELAELVAAAPIGTLHSLCARMLAEFPELSGVPPDARPLEPAEQQLELEAFVSAWLDRAIDDPTHVGHRGCVELLRAHPLGFVRRELRAMVDERPRGTGFELDPSASSIQAARESFVISQWTQYLRQMQGPMAVVFQACVVAQQQGKTTPRQRELRDRIAALVQRHLPRPDPSQVAADVQALVSIRPSAALGPVADLLQQLRNQHRVIATRRERPVLPDPINALEPHQAEHLHRWMALARLARVDWRESLRARALLRYDDLELLTLELLDDPRARHHLRGRYRHLLVDEYQDINPVQAEIIDRLAELCGPEDGEAKVFFVGDPKQSIYRFRGADPEVFARAVVARKEDVVVLADNRRSSPTLARFFSHLFPPLFAGSLPWANVTDLGRPHELARLRDIPDHALVPWERPIVTVRQRDALPGLAVDLLLRQRGAAATGRGLDEEAERVAAHLRGLLDGATLDGGAGEPPGEGRSSPRLRARDLAILVPRWKLAEDYRAALEARGIQADLAGGRGLLLLPEVRDLINLVRLWADERDELAALAVLRGPCFAISDLGLYVLARWPGVDRRVREADPDLPEFAELDELWQAWDEEEDEGGEVVVWPRSRARRFRELLFHGRLDPDRALAALDRAGVILPQSGESPARARERVARCLGEDAVALERGRDTLLAASKAAGARHSADLLADLVTEFRLEAHWLAGPRGRRAVANAWRFVEHVRAMEPEGPDLQRLVAWLDVGAEPAPEGLISPSSDAVTITTWHGAKGKEWPVVVVAGLGEYRGSGGRSSWSSAPIPTLDQGGSEAISVPRIRQPHQGFCAEADPLEEACTNMLAPLEAAEAKRLLYVAMTRARDRLVLSGEADARAHVHYDDKPYLGLDWGFDMKPLIGEPKPAYLCLRPIELLVAGLDLPAAPLGQSVIRPRAATWSLAHLRVIDDEMLLAGLERGARAEAEAEPIPKVEPKPKPEPAPSARTAGPPIQLDFGALFSASSPEAAPPRIWRAGAAMQQWTPSGGRSPWPISELEWAMPLPARRPVLLDDEDPLRLGELFHRAMEQWDFVGDPPLSRELEPLIRATFGERDGAAQRKIATWLLRTLELFADDQPLLAELREARERGQLFHEVDLDAIVPETERDHWISGRIDLLWRDDEGRWCVLDYKVTSKVGSRAQMQELQWEYGPQLLLYRRALERWRPRGEAQELGRFGLWLAPAGRAMWMV